jgi:hypothetical protein
VSTLSKADQLQRKTVGESAGQHGRWERLLDIDRLKTRPHLNDVGLVIKVEGPRGVAVVAMRGGGGGVAVGATTAAAVVGFTVVVSPSL